MTLVNAETGEIVERLSAMERSALTHAEAAIERGLASFMEVGAALSKVRDERLYREEFGTFEAYCRDRWGITDRRARQMIDASAITEALGTGTMVPTSERQARELVGLDADEAAEIMRRAHEATDGKVTAAAIRAVRTPKAPEPATEGEAETGSGQTPGRGKGEPVAGSPTSPPLDGRPAPTPSPAPVVGIDGKTYSRPTPRPKPVVNEDEWSEQDRAEELAGNLARNLSLLYAVTNPERRADYIATWRLGTRSRPVLGQNFITPTHMRRLADALRDFADEWEQAHG